MTTSARTPRGHLLTPGAATRYLSVETFHSGVGRTDSEGDEAHVSTATTSGTEARRDEALAALRTQTIELPSWAFGNSGTRFKVFAQAGVPRDPFEKIADAAQVHRYTGVAPRVSLHIPWDQVEDYDALAKHAADLGVSIGAINSNLFQDDDYMLGSLTHPDATVRAKAVAHHVECIDVMRATGSTDLKIWLPDGLNYPGQDDLRARQDRLAECAGADLRRRSTPSTGSSSSTSSSSPRSTRWTSRTGAPRCCTAWRSATRRWSCSTPATTRRAPTSSSSSRSCCAWAGSGAFDFNSRFYADDDLMVGSADPFQLFRIMHEIVRSGALAPDSGVNFMLDQCHNIEPKIPAQIRSVMNVQEATAKALLVDREALPRAQRSGDVLGANGALMDAYNTDVRPLLAELRESQGLDPNPIAAYAASGYAEKIVAERVGGTQAGWGA